MSEENRPFTVSTDVHMTVSRESLLSKRVGAAVELRRRRQHQTNVIIITLLVQS